MTDICEVCGKPIVGEPVHFLHRDDCREGCGCRRPVHVACCPEPVCAAERGLAASAVAGDGIHWLEVTWADVGADVRIRRDNGETGLVLNVQPYHAELRVTVALDGGRTSVLTVWPTNAVEVEVAAP